MAATIGWFNRLWVRYGVAIGAVAVAFLVRQIITEYVGPGLPTYVTFYPVVMLVAVILGFSAGLVVTVTSALVSAYWILPPEGFAVTTPSDVAGLILFSGVGIFMSAIAEFYRRTRQRLQEKSIELETANEALRQLSSKLISAQEEERKRVAGDIHDTIGACLAGIKFKVEEAQLQIGKLKGTAGECLNNVVPLIQEGIAECRRIQMDLRPSILDDLGLLTAISWSCKRFKDIYSQIRIEEEIDIQEEEIRSSLKIVIYRLMQEAMNNVAKHSKADFIRLSFRKANDGIEFAIQDNGQGFNPEKAFTLESTRRGLGLSSMRERVKFSGGSFAIESGEGKGTVIRAYWPIE